MARRAVQQVQAMVRRFTYPPAGLRATRVPIAGVSNHFALLKENARAVRIEHLSSAKLYLLGRRETVDYCWRSRIQAIGPTIFSSEDRPCQLSAVTSSDAARSDSKSRLSRAVTLTSLKATFTSSLCSKERLSTLVVPMTAH